jgi:hypothetical protein
LVASNSTLLVLDSTVDNVVDVVVALMEEGCLIVSTLQGIIFLQMNLWFVWKIFG